MEEIKNLEEVKNVPMYYAYMQEMHKISAWEDETGFVLGRLISVKKDNVDILGLEVRDIFVKKELRGSRNAAAIVDKYLEEMEKAGKSNDPGFKIKFLVGYINQTDPNKEASLIAQFRYGFKIQKIVDGKVVLVKELGDAPAE